MIGPRARTPGNLVPVLVAILCLICLTQSVTAQAQSEIRNLVVEETRRSDPQTPLQWLAAVDDLINVGEFELAREYLQNTLEAKPSPKALMEVHSELGTPFLMRLLRTSELAPWGAEVSEMVTLAVESVTTAPVRRAAVDPGRGRGG